MKTISNVEQEVNRIRLEIYEETKNLTREQRIERTNKIAEAAAQKYGFKIVASAKEKRGTL
jgi:hypothetical protein